MNKVLIIVILTAIIAFTYSCKKETEEPMDLGLDYFPTEKGFYQVYKVDSIVYDDYFTKIDTFHFYVKMVIQDKFTDNANNDAYRWRKYSKMDSTSWKFCDNYTVTKTKQSLETTIQNKRLINLIFPVVSGKTWDLNAKNIEKEVSSIYTDVDFSESLLGNTYDNCAKANYQEEVNLIQEFVNHETFSKNIGMIHRRSIHKEIKNDKTRGYDVEYIISEYGKE